MKLVIASKQGIVAAVDDNMTTGSSQNKNYTCTLLACGPLLAACTVLLVH